MKYYTMQSLKAFENAIKTGKLKGSTNYVIDEYKKCYKWLSEQMKKRLTNYDDDTPIWMWANLDDITAIDLQDGESCVILEVDVNEADVLVTDYDEWHVILNDGFFDDELFEKDVAGLIKDEEREALQFKDWEMLFEISHDCVNQYTTGSIDITNITLLSVCGLKANDLALASELVKEFNEIVKE